MCVAASLSELHPLSPSSAGQAEAAASARFVHLNGRPPPSVRPRPSSPSLSPRILGSRIFLGMQQRERESGSALPPCRLALPRSVAVARSVTPSDGFDDE